MKKIRVSLSYEDLFDINSLLSFEIDEEPVSDDPVYLAYQKRWKKLQDYIFEKLNKITLRDQESH